MCHCRVLRRKQSAGTENLAHIHRSFGFFGLLSETQFLGVCELKTDVKPIPTGTPRRDICNGRNKVCKAEPIIYALVADRGYTGHEHLVAFGLINMNGRVYDPVLGRFLSPDPYVQLPGSVDGFNRYGYCLNNPLIYTDPDGEWFITALMTLASGYLGGLQANNYEVNPVDWNWRSVSTYTSIIYNGYTGYNTGKSIENELIKRKIGKSINKIAHDESAINYNPDGQSIEYSNESATDFVDYYFEKFPKSSRKALKSIYADGRSVANMAKYDVDSKSYIDLQHGGKSGGFIVPYLDGTSNMYLSESLFTDKWKLYTRIGHELMHVHHNWTTKGGLNSAHPMFYPNRSSSEYYAYKFVIDQNLRWADVYGSKFPVFAVRARNFQQFLDKNPFYDYNPFFHYNFISGVDIIDKLP